MLLVWYEEAGYHILSTHTGVVVYLPNCLYLPTIGLVSSDDMNLSESNVWGSIGFVARRYP